MIRKMLPFDFFSLLEKARASASSWIFKGELLWLFFKIVESIYFALYTSVSWKDKDVLFVLVQLCRAVNFFSYKIKSIFWGRFFDYVKTLSKKDFTVKFGKITTSPRFRTVSYWEFFSTFHPEVWRTSSEVMKVHGNSIC